MWQLRRTHLFPDLGKDGNGGLESPRACQPMRIAQNRDIRRLAHAFGLLPDVFVARFDSTRRRVRALHRDIYYRPMLPQVASMPDDAIALDSAAAAERFASVGFVDPKAARARVERLTTGVSRPAKINRVILPAMLKWLGEGENPDMGLLELEKIEGQFGPHSPYLGILRDSPSAAQRLCHILASSRYLGQAMEKSVESVAWLADDAHLTPRSPQSLQVQCDAALRRFSDDRTRFATSLRAFYRRERERIAIGWMASVIADEQAMTALTDLTDALLRSALAWANGQAPRVKIAVIALGRYGGRELNFTSDADVMVLFEPDQHSGSGESAAMGSSPADALGSADAASQAAEVLSQARVILSDPAIPEPAVELDFSLRPEGRRGALVRSFESCRRYYAQWAQTWEAQALLRARFAAGDEDLAQRFLAVCVDPVRYPERGITDQQRSEIRTLKARMEAERLPRGISAERHLKLGRGGLSDVEWTVQLLQLANAGAEPAVRVTSTMAALSQLERTGKISHADADILRTAWQLASEARNANFLWSGRALHADEIPRDAISLGAMSACAGHGARRGSDYGNQLHSALRKSRAVVNRLFYGKSEDCRAAQ